MQNIKEIKDAVNNQQKEDFEQLLQNNGLENLHLKSIEQLSNINKQIRENLDSLLDKTRKAKIKIENLKGQKRKSEIKLN